MTNNRTIKFRIWDTNKKIFLWEQNLYINSQFSDAILMACPNDNVYYDRKRLIIQQFTGFLDKNGKEIYEGDIIFFWTNGGKDKITSEVYYENGDLFPRIEDSHVLGNNCEIIGHTNDFARVNLS